MTEETSILVRPPPQVGFDTRQVAELIGWPPERIRYLVKRGLLSPPRSGRNYRFSFQDMVLIRTAKRLREARVPPRKAYAALAELRDRRSGGGDWRPLSARRLFAEGSSVVVQEEDALWDARTGQGHIGFEARPLRGEVRGLDEREASPRDELVELDSDDWYNLGLDLEDVAPAKSLEAYRRAIALDPDNADAHVNLGRMFQVQGDLSRAGRHYLEALETEPEHPLALYNLGTVFDEQNDLHTALEYYAKATSIPDAHYNLARIFELRGDEVASMRHMRQYRALVKGD